MVIPMIKTDRVIVVLDDHPGPLILMKPKVANTGTVLKAGSGTNFTDGQRVVVTPGAGIKMAQGQQTLILLDSDDILALFE